MVGCCAPECSKRTEQGVRFFGFPKDPKRRKEWEYLLNRPHWSATDHSKLCQFHFEDSMFKRKEPNWRLKPNAIPTIFPHNRFDTLRKLEQEGYYTPGGSEEIKSQNGSNIEIIHVTPTPELAVRDHSYISNKKKNSTNKSTALQPPPVGQEIEISADAQGVERMAYKIIQTDCESFSTEVFPSDDNQIIHRIIPQVTGDLYSEVIATVELNGDEVNEDEQLNGGDDDTETEEIEASDSLPREEEDVHVQTGPTVDVRTCDDLCFRLRVTVSTLKTALTKLQKERDSYKNKLRKEKRKSKGLEKQLMNQSVIPSFLQDDQLKYLQKGSHRGFAWSEETIKQANELKMACGTRGYIALLMHNFPLPGLSTLRSNKRKENESKIIETEEIEVHVP